MGLCCAGLCASKGGDIQSLEEPHGGRHSTKKEVRRKSHHGPNTSLLPLQPHHIQVSVQPLMGPLGKP